MHVSELPWERKVKHIGLHFTWKKTQMMLALLVASRSLTAALGAYEPPSCSVNRPSCPSCIIKPPHVHSKSKNIQQRTNPSPWECQVKWRRHRKKQRSPSQVSMAIRRQSPKDPYHYIFKAGGLMWPPRIVQMANQLHCSPTSEPAGHRALFQGIWVQRLHSKTCFPVLLPLLVFIEILFFMKKTAVFLHCLYTAKDFYMDICWSWSLK